MLASEEDLDGDGHWQVIFPSRIEDLVELKQSWSFDQDIDGTVGYFDNVGPLSWLLLRGSKVDTAKSVSYVKQLEESA